MGSYRDIMQVCLNGHVITERFNTHPEFRENYCTNCGQKTITKCPTCKADIPGDIVYDDMVILSGFAPVAPQICKNCGNRFPWFEIRQKENEEELAKKRNAEEERKFEKKMATVKKIEVKIEGHGNVVNLGSMVENVISNTLKLTQAGNNDIAAAIENLTKAVNSESSLTENEKQQYLEQLKTLSEEALKPVDKRLPKSVLQTIINFGLGALSMSGNLAQVWSTWGPAIKAFFLP